MDEIDNTNVKTAACRMFSITSCKECNKKCGLYKSGMTDLCNKLNPLKKDGLNYPTITFPETTRLPTVWPPIPDEYGRYVERSKGVHSKQYWRMVANETYEQRKTNFCKSTVSGVVPEAALESKKEIKTITSDHIAYEDSGEPDSDRSISEQEHLQYKAEVGKISLKYIGITKTRLLVKFETFHGVRFERKIERIYFLQNSKFQLAEIETFNKVHMTENVPIYEDVWVPNYRPIQDNSVPVTMVTSTYKTRSDQRKSLERSQLRLIQQNKERDRIKLDAIEQQIKSGTGAIRY